MIIRSKSQRPFGIDNVGQSLCRIRNDGQFAGQKIGALLEFIFILKPRVKSLEVRPVPKHVGFFSDRNQTRYALLDEQCISDVLQERTTAAGCPAVFGQFASQWLGEVEDSADVAFVVRQNQNSSLWRQQ